MPTYPARWASGAPRFDSFSAGNPTPNCCAGVDPCKPRLRRGSLRPSLRSGSGIAVRRSLAVVISSEAWRPRMLFVRQSKAFGARRLERRGRKGRGQRLVCMAKGPPMTRSTSVPRLLFTREESAHALGMSLSHFQRHVQPHVPCVYVGQLRQYRPEDLKSWAERARSGGPRVATS